MAAKIVKVFIIIIIIYDDDDDDEGRECLCTVYNMSLADWPCRK